MSPTTFESAEFSVPVATFEAETPPNSGKRAHRRKHAAQRAQTDPRRRNASPENATTPEQIQDGDALLWAEASVNSVRLFTPATYESASSTEESEEPEVSDTLLDLINTRAQLAEISARAREGKLLSNRFSSAKLARLNDLYTETKDAFIMDELAKLEEQEPLDDMKKAAFIALLSAKEDGALMGEEAQYYLDRHHYNKSKLEKSIEWYNELDRKKKIALNIGAVAISAAGGAALGLAAGGLAAGAAVSSRFGRSYFREEAKRRKSDTSLSEDEKLRALQQSATLKSSNATDRQSTYDALKESDETSFSDTYEQTLTRIHDNEALQRQNTEKERKKETKEKRRALGKAALTVVAGAGAGYAISHWRDAWEAVSGGNDSREQLTANTDSAADIQNNTARVQAAEMAPFEGRDSVDAADTSEPAPEAPTDQNRALFGEFANQRVTIDIPAGSSVWDQLEATVDNQNPFMPYPEKQRIVGNMVVRLQEQNPGRNFNFTNAGERFSIDLN